MKAHPTQEKRTDFAGDLNISRLIEHDRALSEQLCNGHLYQRGDAAFSSVTPMLSGLEGGGLLFVFTGKRKGPALRASANADPSRCKIKALPTLPAAD